MPSVQTKHAYVFNEFFRLITYYQACEKLHDCLIGF